MVELADSRNEEVGEGEDACEVAAAAGVRLDEVAAFRGLLVGVVFLLSGVEVTWVFSSFCVCAACVVAAAALEADASDIAADTAEADASASAADTWAACCDSAFEFAFELSFELSSEFELEFGFESGVLSGAAGMVMYPPTGPSKVFAAVL